MGFLHHKVMVEGDPVQIIAVHFSVLPGKNTINNKKNNINQYK